MRGRGKDIWMMPSTRAKLGLNCAAVAPKSSLIGNLSDNFITGFDGAANPIQTNYLAVYKGVLGLIAYKRTF